MDQLGPFEEAPTLAIAVSGGSDSLALAFLLHQWVSNQKGSLLALHVDHKLRPESTKEAQQVSQWMTQRNIPCTILTWDHDLTPKTGLQEKARAARYALLQKACCDQNILHLVTAHHAEDQTETFIIRQQSKSTDYGLSGMSAVTYFKTGRLIRPALSLSKKELKTTLGSHPHLEDPSNKNCSFHRVKLRQKKLEKIHLAPYQEKRRKEEREASRFLALYATLSPKGYGQIPLSSLDQSEPPIVERALGFLIRCIGNLDYLPQPRSVQKLVQKLYNQDYSTSSFGRCTIHVSQKKLWLTPDIRLLPQVNYLSIDQKFWDRFLLQNSSLPQDIYIKPLGQEGWLQVKSRIKTPLPYCTAITFPSYWKKEKVVCIPFLSFGERIKNYPSFSYQPKNSLLAEIFV